MAPPKKQLPEATGNENEAMMTLLLSMSNQINSYEQKFENITARLSKIEESSSESVKQNDILSNRLKCLEDSNSASNQTITNLPTGQSITPLPIQSNDKTVTVTNPPSDYETHISVLKGDNESILKSPWNCDVDTLHDKLTSIVVSDFIDTQRKYENLKKIRNLREKYNPTESKYPTVHEYNEFKTLTKDLFTKSSKLVPVPETRKAALCLFGALLDRCSFVHKIPNVDLTKSIKTMNTTKITMLCRKLYSYLYSDLTVFKLQENTVESMNQEFKDNYKDFVIPQFTELRQIMETKITSRYQYISKSLKKADGCPPTKKKRKCKVEESEPGEGMSIPNFSNKPTVGEIRSLELVKSIQSSDTSTMSSMFKQKAQAKRTKSTSA